MQLAQAQTQPSARTRWGAIALVIGGWAAMVGLVAWKTSRQRRKGWHRSFNDAWPERLPGGHAAGFRPEDFDPVQLRRGTLVELEHTNDRRLAMEIAMDHLVEDPRYYQKLARIHQD
jgi:hypothetical protein